MYKNPTTWDLKKKKENGTPSTWGPAIGSIHTEKGGNDNDKRVPTYQSKLVRGGEIEKKGNKLAVGKGGVGQEPPSAPPPPKETSQKVDSRIFEEKVGKKKLTRG